MMLLTEEKEHYVMGPSDYQNIPTIYFDVIENGSI